MSSEAEKEKVRDASDIVEVVSRFVTLKSAGKNLKGLCPFHKEKTPSFIVTPDRQSFKCFGCGAGGDVFEFLMKMEGLSFGEALEQLAQRANIPLSRSNPEASNQDTLQRRQLLAVMGWAVERFQQALNSPDAGMRVRKYLEKRKISQTMVERLQLGFAPDGWDNLLRAGLRDHYTEELLEQAGLVIKHEAKQKKYDRFRNRLMFPIWDMQGRPVAFGGRVLDNSEPKYLNSPETPIFQKGELLYGLHLAREAARQQKRLILVEGYMDALACHSIGVEETVASLGTALTPKQAQLIKRYVSSVLLLYDMDEAGINAGLRGFEILNQAGIAVKAVRLKGAKDPDEFIRTQGEQAFRKCLEQATSMVEFVLDAACTQFDPKTVDGKMAIVQKTGRLIIQYPSGGIEQAEYIHLLAERLHLLDSQVKTELDRIHVPVLTHAHASAAAVPASAQKPLEKEKAKVSGPPVEEALLMRTLLRFPLLLDTFRADIKPDWISQAEYRELLSAMLAIETIDPEHEDSWLEEWLKTVPVSWQEQVRTLLAQESDMGSPDQVVQDCLNRIKMARLRKQINRLQVQIQEVEKTGDLETLKQLAQEKITLAQQLKQLGVSWQGHSTPGIQMD